MCVSAHNLNGFAVTSEVCAVRVHQTKAMLIACDTPGLYILATWYRGTQAKMQGHNIHDMNVWEDAYACVINHC